MEMVVRENLSFCRLPGLLTSYKASVILDKDGHWFSTMIFHHIWVLSSTYLCSQRKLLFASKMIDFRFSGVSFSCINSKKYGGDAYSAHVASKSLKLLQTHLTAVSWLILNEWLSGSIGLSWRQWIHTQKMVSNFNICHVQAIAYVTWLLVVLPF